MRARRILLPLAAAALLAGCGDDDNPVEGGAIGLTEWLPKDAVTYTAVDIAAFEEELDLPEDANPMKEPALEPHATAFAALLARRGPEPEAVLEAVDPGEVTATAASGSADGVVVTALATVADEGEIGSRLGDLGYREADGVLEGGDGRPAIRLEEGIVFVSDDPDALREIPKEQREDPPLELLGELDGEDLAVTRIDDQCFTEIGAATRADGAAELAVLVPGGAEAERMEPDTGEVGEADADGEVVVKPVIEPGDGASARTLVSRFFPGYDCE